jgi:hypothetical protein
MIPILRITALALLLSGCSTALLEDVGEVGEINLPLRACSEQTKVFNTFTMRAKRIAWKGDKRDAGATLTLELTFANDKDFPVALSNSGNGVLYTLEFSLKSEKDSSHAPKEASGILLIPEPKKFEEPPKPGPFGYTTRPPSPEQPIKTDNTRDVNFRIKPGEPEEGKLTFQIPRGNYRFIIARKFADKTVPGQPTAHIAVCKISAA